MPDSQIQEQIQKQIQKQIQTIIDKNLLKLIEAQATVILDKSETEWDSSDTWAVRNALTTKIKKETGIEDARTLRNLLKKAIPPMSPLGEEALEKIALRKVATQETIKSIINDNVEKLINDQIKIILENDKSVWEQRNTGATIVALITKIEEAKIEIDHKLFKSILDEIKIQNIGTKTLENTLKTVTIVQPKASPPKEATPIKSPAIIDTPEKDQKNQSAQNPINEENQLKKDEALAKQIQAEDHIAEQQSIKRKQEEEQASEAFIKTLHVTPQKGPEWEKESPITPPKFSTPPVPPRRLSFTTKMPVAPSRTPTTSPVFLQEQVHTQNNSSTPIAPPLPTTPARPPTPSANLPHSPASPGLPDSDPQPVVTIPHDYKALEAYIAKMERFKNKNQLHSGSFYGKSNQIEKLKTATKAITLFNNTELPLHKKLITLETYISENKKHTGVALFHRREGDLESILEKIKQNLIMELAPTPYGNNFAELKIYIKTAKKKKKENTLNAGLTIGSFVIKSKQVKKLELAEKLMKQKQSLQANPPISLHKLKTSKQVFSEAIKENANLTAGSNPLHADGKLHEILDKLKNEIEAEITKRKIEAPAGLSYSQ